MADEAFATLTHARLRVLQGDLGGARELLREIVRARPAQPEAQRLLESLEGLRDAARESTVDVVPPPPQPGDPAELTARFRRHLVQRNGPARQRRIARLESWLERIRGGRAERAAVEEPRARRPDLA